MPWWQPNPAEVNFRAPWAAKFRALQSGELFLFKLHAPRNVIGGDRHRNHAHDPGDDGHADGVEPGGDGGAKVNSTPMRRARDLVRGGFRPPGGAPPIEPPGERGQ